MADGPLLLGLVDENMSENDDRICGWATNKIGGTPNWLLGPPSHYPACPICKNMLYLVCQVYCPLSDSIFHRVLYIFGCINASCWNKNTSWEVLRSQARDSNFGSKNMTENKSTDGFEVDDWCDEADDWGNETDTTLTGLEQCTGNLKLFDKNQCKKEPESVENSTTPQLQNTYHTTGQKHDGYSLSCVPHFSPLYVSVIEAPDKKESSAQLTKHEKKLLSEYQQREGVHVADFIDSDENIKGWTGEMYEIAAVKQDNKAFHKFNKTLQACPQQCLRYQWNGTPVSMVITNPSELLAKVPPCQYCGAERVFELQFMPALVSSLKLAKQRNSTHRHDSHNLEEIDKTEQLSQGNDQFNLQAFRKSETFTDDPSLQEEQRKAFMATVNQIRDVTIEFGTVMVFTCSQSCWGDLENSEGANYLEEFCLLEADPDYKLFQ